MPCRFPPGARPPRPLSWCFLAASLAACGGGESRAATLGQGDSVQIQAAYLGPGWHPGTVGQVGECTALLVPVPPPPAQATRFNTVPFDSVTAIRRGGKALPAAALHQTYGSCSRSEPTRQSDAVVDTRGRAGLLTHTFHDATF